MVKVRIGLVTLALLVALAGPVDAKQQYGDELELPIPITLPMHPGQTAWLPLVWLADDTVDEVAVTVTAPAGYSVEYPAGRAFTSLYGSASLAKHNIDFSAFKLSVPYGASGLVKVDVHATWVRRGNNGNGNGNGAGTPGSLDVSVTVPLVAYLGRDLATTPSSVAVKAANPAWVELPFRGGAPMLHDFRVTVAGPPGLVVTYPGNGASSGLNDSPSLQGGASDHSAVRLDATAVPKGAHTLTVTATYATATPKTVTLEVPLAVS